MSTEKARAGPVDWIVLGIILIFSIGIGLYHGLRHKLVSLFKKKPTNTEEVNGSGNGNSKLDEYQSAKSSMGVLPIALSLMASSFSAVNLVGNPTEVYQYGIDYWLVAFGFAIPPILGAFVFGPFFIKINSQTVFEYIFMRYKSKAVKLLANTVYVLRTFMSTGFITLGPATAISLILEVEQNASIAIIGFIGTFYTAIGGMKAVIWTDVFQSAVMIISVTLVVVKGVIDAEGLSNVWRINEEGGRLNLFKMDLDPFKRQSFYSYFFGAATYFSMSYCFDQQMIQRFRAARTHQSARTALLLNVPIVILFVSICVFIGLVVYANYSDCDPLVMGRIQTSNQYSSFFVLNNMHMWPGAIGFFIGALFCSSLSSLASCLNSLSLIIWEDFLMRFGFFQSFTPTSKLNANKLIVVMCGVVATCICYVLSLVKVNLSQLNNALIGSLSAPLIGLFLLSMFFSISNRWGAVFGTVCGITATFWIAVGAIVINPVAPRLDVSIEGCYNESIYLNTSTGPIISFNETQSSLRGVDKLYSLSFMWYTTFGAFVTVITGLIMSILTCGLTNQVDRSLLVFDLTWCFNRDVPKQQRSHNHQLQQLSSKPIKIEEDSSSMVVDFELKERF